MADQLDLFDSLKLDLPRNNLIEKCRFRCRYYIPKEYPGQEPDGLCEAMAPQVRQKGKRIHSFYPRVSSLKECPGFKSY